MMASMLKVIGASAAGGALLGYALVQAYLMLGSIGMVSYFVFVGGGAFIAGAILDHRKEKAS